MHGFQSPVFPRVRQGSLWEGGAVLFWVADEVLGVGVSDWPTQERKQGERKGHGGGMISSLVEVHSCPVVRSSVLEESSRKVLYVFWGSKMSSSQTPEILPL